MRSIYVAVGSNLDPAANVERGLRALARSVKLRRISTFYRSAPLDRPKQPPFLNGVIEIETDLAPRDLKFGVLRAVESSLERRRTADKSAPRTLDLDLILYGDLVLEEEDLILPDPDIASRPFLAIPLLELCPSIRIPGSSRPLREIAGGPSFPEDALEPLPDFTRCLQAALLADPGHERNGA